MVRWSFLSSTRIIVAVVALTSALFLTVSLITYTTHDSSCIYSVSENSTISNSAGFLGAHAAALVLFFLGCAGLLVVPFLLFVAFSLCAQEKLLFFWRRCIGFLLLLISLATISSVVRCELYTSVYPGGYLGTFCSFLLTTTLSKDLIMPFLIILLWASCILLIEFSWVAPILGLFKLWYKKLALQNYFEFIHNWARFIRKKIFKKQYTHTHDELELLVHETIHGAVLEDPLWDTLSQAPEPAYRAQIPEALITKPFKLPSKTLFTAEPLTRLKKHQENQNQRAHILEQKLERFGILGTVVAILPGPIVTLFEYQPDIDVKISKILALEDDLALALQAVSLRIIAPIPGRSVVGFEVANQTRQQVLFSDIVRGSSYTTFIGKLPLIIGYDTIGNHVIIDLLGMPHILVAGSTGSGKSVALNAMLMSLLCYCTPEELTIILIDPKRLEFAAYADIAHLLFPIVTEPNRAILALRWAVQTMEKRYAIMAAAGVRSIQDYNSIPDNHLSYIVIIIDELADLMMTAGKDVEDLIARLAQMSRAAGIHLIIATQRPSVDVITGLIKVNFPARIAFKVTSKIDSRTILDCAGADKLLGKGDMLFLDAQGALKRAHGAYVTDKEIQAVVAHIKQQRAPDYITLDIAAGHGDFNDNSADELLFQEVLGFLAQVDEISISLLQRRFRIGYNRSARIIEALEARGHIVPSDGSKMRKVLR